ncbi:hypothetical protein EDEG_03587 [Edhazardia aedis USNM 41457]|uniref:Peptidyl-prolyl cis-trans isomerase n=1 Tax=Edhazardia aedis (strain USNM 41457) TaxID=1003232 RepID=J8ZQG4_EDHAE|nr:hypothetical protein EDEG_03587 [Edhazardia aedis USNM 41457]|eukprot:EJW01943.1 hypothetical protein EDEG_03587 [Edhazardia aedis USNM 41457]
MKVQWIQFLILAFQCAGKNSPEVTHEVIFKVKYMPKGTTETVEKEIVINLYGKVCPKTVSNFYKYATNSEPHLNYKDCEFHRVMKNFMIQGGNLEGKKTGNDKSEAVIEFKDENFILSHEIGCISMANRGPNTNTSQFFITVAETPWLNGRHVVFGKVKDDASKNVAKEISMVDKFKDGQTPIHPITIVESKGVQFVEIEQEESEIRKDEL